MAKRCLRSLVARGSLVHRRLGGCHLPGLLALTTLSVACDGAPPAGSSAPGNAPAIPVKAHSEPLCRQPRMHWTSRGVGGGGALFVPSINPHRGTEIFIASDMTDVFHSVDYGRSWRTLPFYVFQGGMQSYVRFTADPRVRYALNTPETPRTPSIIKSIDGGRTWDAPVTTPGDSPAPKNILVDYRNPKRVLYADEQQLYYSGDGGQSFASVYTTTWPDGMVVAGAHFAGSTIYAATTDGVLVSHDDGGTFGPELNQGIPADESIVSFAATHRGRTTRFFAVTYKNQDSDGQRTIYADITGLDWPLFAGVYRLNVAEDSWERVTPDLSPLEKLSMVATAGHQPGIAYVAGTARDEQDPENLGRPIVLKTDDGGRSWRHVFLTEGNANVATGWSGTNGDMGWEFADMALGLAVSPSDARRVVLTDLGYVHVSDDGGRHWRQAYVDPRDQNREGEDTPMSKSYRTSGVEQTSGWWLTWTGPRTIFGSITDIISVFSQDGGESWSRDGGNGLRDNTTYHVVTHPSGVLYGATSSVHDLYQSPWMRDQRIDPGTGTVVTSSDGGAHWSIVHDFQHPVVWLALDPNPPNHLYASVVNSQVGGIYRLDLDQLEQGATPLPAPPRTKGHPYNVHVLPDGNIVATYSGHQDGNTRVFTDRAGVFLLPPGAAAWEDRSAPQMHYWTKDIVIDPRDDNRWYVAVFSHDEQDFGGLYRTTDRGLTWQRIAARHRVESCAIDPKNPNRMYMTTQGEGLWLTENLEAEQPEFRQDRDYPFEQPVRVFWNPYDPREVWTVSFGGGMRVARER